MAEYATLLRDHVTLTCRSVDRFFLQSMSPSCSRWGGCAGSCAGSGGSRIPSSAAFGKIGDGYVKDIPPLRRGEQDPGSALQEGRE